MQPPETLPAPNLFPLAFPAPPTPPTPEPLPPPCMNLSINVPPSLTTTPTEAQHELSLPSRHPPQALQLLQQQQSDAATSKQTRDPVDASKQRIPPQPNANTSLHYPTLVNNRQPYD